MAALALAVLAAVGCVVLVVGAAICGVLRGLVGRLD
jgi:hypothetical protein